MNVNRAQQILQAQDRITVKLDGIPVWIDSVDGVSHKAKVHNEHNPAEVKVVSVDMLQEA